MPKQPAPTPWTPKIDVRDTGEHGHHEITIKHAISPWPRWDAADHGCEWSPEEMAGHKLTTKWIATIGALTLGPLLNDIEKSKHRHRCQNRFLDENKELQIWDGCYIDIEDVKTMMEQGGGGCMISVPSEDYKEWVKKVQARLTSVIEQMGADW